MVRPAGNLSWHFMAKDVIDFAWAADPDYTHDRALVPNGPELHFFYQKNDKTVETWKTMEEHAVKTFQYLNENFGRYPFETYSIIQGGDGGMEYPMCTLILGEGQLRGVGTGGKAALGKVVAVKGAGDHARSARQAQVALQAFGQPGAAAPDAHQGRVVVQQGTHAVAQFGVQRLRVKLQHRRLLRVGFAGIARG